MRFPSNHFKYDELPQLKSVVVVSNNPYTFNNFEQLLLKHNFKDIQILDYSKSSLNLIKAYLRIAPIQHLYLFDINNLLENEGFAKTVHKSMYKYPNTSMKVVVPELGYNSNDEHQLIESDILYPKKNFIIELFKMYKKFQE